MPETAHQIDLPDEVHDLLLSYQRDDESFAETLDRVFTALVPHGVNFDRVGIDPKELDDNTRFVLERWPDEDGYVDTYVYPKKTSYLRANRTVIEHTSFESVDPLDCVLCDHSSETPEEHHEHMEEVHGC